MKKQPTKIYAWRKRKQFTKEQIDCLKEVIKFFYWQRCKHDYEKFQPGGMLISKPSEELPEYFIDKKTHNGATI